jgi:hypothetical protein
MWNRGWRNFNRIEAASGFADMPVFDIYCQHKAERVGSAEYNLYWGIVKAKARPIFLLSVNSAKVL